ncbi:MAG: hypothetical protein EAY75_07905 [Bacteroidetes bacterium]|nr:MAG: hypothetical protein EAY75_07905 [Bacteroidota bacterium]
MSNTIIIRKQGIRLVAATPQLGLAYRQQLTDEWLASYVHALNQQVAALNLMEVDGVIPKIEVTVQAAQLGSTATQWIPTIAYAVAKALMGQATAQIELANLQAQAAASQLQPYKVGSAASANLQMEALLQYLFQGTLPHWCRHQGFNPQQFLANWYSSQNTQPFLTRFLDTINQRGAKELSSLQALERLVRLTPHHHWPKLAELVWAGLSTTASAADTPAGQPVLDWLARHTKVAEQHLKALYLQALLAHQQAWLWPFLQATCLANEAHAQAAAHNRLVLARWQLKLLQLAQSQGLDKLSADLQMQPTTVEPTNNNTISPSTAKAQPTTDAIYSGQAGLVLLFPFLPRLFTLCGLLTPQNDFVSPLAAHKAVFLMQHLAGNATHDWDLALEKLCCALPVSTLLLHDAAKLSNDDIAAANELLQAILEKWHPLKNSSTKALQETFLQRFGKLNTGTNVWQLHVERTGVDVLLDRLPWSISMIKLPWLKQLIEVTW